jgi:hypothetical protein
MRLFTLVLSLAAALVLAVAAATAARPTKPTTGIISTQFASTPSPDSIHRDVSLTVTLTHSGLVNVRVTPIIHGVDGGPIVTTFGRTGTETFTFGWCGTDPDRNLLPGHAISFRVELFTTRGLHEVPVQTVTTETFYA